uniref:Aurora kinase n=1 Tax=Panagrolaimus davidi TaxID=227884 RepID=A0A914PQV6_9BILA
MTAIEPIIPFNVKDYNFIEKLGENAIGDIYSAEERSTQKNYCIKVINKKKLRNPARAKQVLETLSSLDHKNITKIYGIIEISKFGSPD